MIRASRSALLALSFLFVLAWAGPTAQEIKIINGTNDQEIPAKAVSVHVKVMGDPEARVFPRDIQVKFELRLREQGIKVVPSGAKNKLEVHINAIWVDKDVRMAVAFSVQFKEEVFFKTAKGEFVPGTGVTWSQSNVGWYGVKVVNERVATDVERCVDAFLNSYLAANPK